jgi:hypothetical protein
MSSRWVPLEYFFRSPQSRGRNRPPPLTRSVTFNIPRDEFGEIVDPVQAVDELLVVEIPLATYKNVTRELNEMLATRRNDPERFHELVLLSEEIDSHLYRDLHAYVRAAERLIDLNIPLQSRVFSVPDIFHLILAVREHDHDAILYILQK